MVVVPLIVVGFADSLWGWSRRVLPPSVGWRGFLWLVGRAVMDFDWCKLQL